MKTNQSSAAKIANILLSYGVVKLSPEAPFTWASGMKSPIYCNNRELLSLASEDDRDMVVDEIRDVYDDFFDAVDAIVGVATGAIPWSSMAAYLEGVPYGYVISAPKDHGADSNQPTPEEEQARLAKCLIGKFPANAKVVIIEDLISTGGSSLHAVKAVRAAGYEVAGMVALFSYGFDEAHKLFEEAGCEVVTLTDFDTLTKVAFENGQISEGEFASLQDWRKNARAWSQARGGK